MDHAHLDDFARSLASTTPRRAVLAALAGSTLGLTSAPGLAKKKKKATLCLNGQTVTASGKKKKKLLTQGATPGACSTGGGGGGGGCPAGTKRCNGDCIDAGACCTTGDCDPCLREICVNGSCACPGGMARDGRDVCSVFFSCVAIGQTTTNPAFCCSGRGNAIPNAQFFCVPGTTTCATDTDCLHGQHCIGNLCAATYVGTVGEQCADRAYDICSTRNQCVTGLCEDNFCKICSSNAQCQVGNTTSPVCFCENDICLRRTTTPLVTACSLCPANTAYCKFVAASNQHACYPLCRTS